MEAESVMLAFDAGTIVVRGEADRIAGLPNVRHDPRSNTFRAEARHYRSLVEHLRRAAIPYQDDARAYDRTPWPLLDARTPFPHQTEAVAAWAQAGQRGVVVLPTGTG